MDADLPPVIYLSRAGIVADGTTDRAKELQAFFDRAQNGQPIEIVNDLKGALVTSGNDVWPNTTVRSLEGARWLLAPGSTRGILRNKHPLASWPTGAKKQDGTVANKPTPPDAEHGDHDIAVIGGVFDGNRRSGGWPNDGRTPTNDHPVLGRDNLMVSTLQFYGVHHLSFQNVHVWDSPSLAVHVGNILDLSANDCEIGCPAVIYNSNTDGFHINGPCRNISIHNIHFYQTGDDALPINADDSMESTTEGNQATYFGMTAGWGPIEHVRIRGVYLDRCSSGIRTLSATQRIDDVIISDVQGSCFVAPILLHKYLFNHDGGNMGQFTLENVNVRASGYQYDGEAGGLHAPARSGSGEVVICNTNIDNLILRDISHVPVSTAPWAYMAPCHIKLLNINGFTCPDESAASNGVHLLQMDGVTIDSAVLNGINWSSNHPQGGVFLQNNGAIGKLATGANSLPAQAKLIGGNPPATQPSSR